MKEPGRLVVAVFTGNRSEYGLLLPILEALADHPRIDYRLIVSGAHLDDRFGHTVSEIRNDGFTIHAELAMSWPTHGRAATARAISAGIMALSGELERLDPDVLLVYGDRFEAFAALTAATQMAIPTAHIEGGDLTEGGALDDSVRHAMSKLAHLHFATNKQAANRLLGMGEEPWRVNVVGLPIIDLIRRRRFASVAEVTSRLGLDPARPVILFTQHSITTEADRAEAQIVPSLQALCRLAAAGCQIVATYPNNDEGCQAIIAKLEAPEFRDLSGVQLHRSLGRHLYHGVLGLAGEEGWRVACAGNSSSGIKETPAFGCPTVNIGSRQQGRLRTDNVLEADHDVFAIEAALQRCLFAPEQRARAMAAIAKNPYGSGEAGPCTANILASVAVDRSRLLRKKMNLRGESRDGWFR